MWELYRVVLRLHSPLHVGYLKVGPLMRTRPYVLGKTIWGAVTAALALHQFAGDFEKAREETKRILAFSYFYPALEPKSPLWPCYTRDGLCYGEHQISAAEFERRLISVYGSTALDYSCNAAAVGSLHEVEFISPYDLREARPVYLVGYIFVRQKNNCDWRAVLNEIRLGGERKSGWGRVTLAEDPTRSEQLFDIPVDLKKERPRVYVKQGAYIRAHACVENVKARGQIEPLVGRETCESARFGGCFPDSVPICWVPGSCLLADCEYEIDAYGVWRAISLASSTAPR